MNPKLVRQAIEYAVKLCAKFNDRIVITINGTGGMGNSTEIRPYCNEGFSYDPDLEAIIVKKKEGRTFIDTDSIKAIHCYKQEI